MYSRMIREFLSRVKVDDSGCWLWQGSCGSTWGGHKKGYGQFYYRRKLYYAHRFLYELMVGPIPPGMYACHTCGVPSCVNPNHIYEGTPKDNMRDRVRHERERKARLRCSKDA